MVNCVYCGEEEATTVIVNPNFDDDNFTWNVCKDCKDTIRQQQKLSFGAVLSTMKDDFSKNYGERLMTEANVEIEKIAKRAKKPIMNACIFKKEDGKYDLLSVEFTGDKNIKPRRK